MAALAGRRAIVIGSGGPFPTPIARTLEAQGVHVRSVAPHGDPAATITALSPPDIVVICPPVWTGLPDAEHGMSAAAAMASLLGPAEAWTRVAVAAMRPRGSGVVVHITGLSGLGGWPGWSITGAGFAAVHNYVAATAVEEAPFGLRVNALVPGVTEAAAETIALAVDRPLEEVRERIPAGRFMSEDDLGNALIYLVHPNSSYVTGEVLVVDGGWDSWGRLYAVAR